jgi:aspartyl-tRNA(Asn)/glutamyl-tRNA(Gln) amidotransferase subunit C
MAKIDHNVDIDRITTLARIYLSEEEKKDLVRDIDSILARLAKLSEIDVEGIEASAHASPLYDVIREDVAGKVLPTEIALRSAPRRRDNQFIVPKIVE